MFHSRKSNNEIKLFHERALRMICNDQISSFQELLDRDNSFTVHHFIVQSSAIEMFKVINIIAASIIDGVFTTYHSYDLRSKSKFIVPNVGTVYNSQISVQYYDLEYDTRYIKDFETLDKFKGKIQKWKSMNKAKYKSCHFCK